MATIYRKNRNLEASIVDYITSKLTADGWTNITVDKVLSRVYASENGGVFIQLVRPDTRRKEIGGKSHLRYYNINFKIYGTNEGQRLDLADCIFDYLEDDINYYTYTITSGVATKVLAGKLVTSALDDRGKDLENTDDLDEKDRFRHTVACKVRIVLT